MNSRSDNIGIAWKPGFWRQAPWAALLSLVGFVACCVGLAAILWDSDGKEVSTWPRASSSGIHVSVLLSLIITFANLFLAVALSKGYEISWWLQALRGAQVRKLYFDLEIRSDIFAVFRQNWGVDKFLIAAVVSLAVSVLDGPVIQKASVIQPKTYVHDSDVVVHVLNGSLPANFSGFSGLGEDTDLLTPLFSDVSRAYNSRESITLPMDGCEANSTCKLTLSAPGFDISCNETEVPYDFLVLGSASIHNNITTFNVTMAFGGEQVNVDVYSSINTSALYKPDADCVGNLIKRECVLRLATVRYPISVTNGTVTMQSWSGQNDTIEIGRFYSKYNGGDILWTGGIEGGFESMLGGIYYVMQDLYNSSVVLRLEVQTFIPYLIFSFGQASSNYLTSDISTYGNCTMTWEDPTTDLMNTVSELMLRSAIAYSNFNSSAVVPQNLTAQETRVANAYKSRYEYLGITLACMVLQAIVILYLLFGWHRLGSDVSLHAFDIARALEAPLLRTGSSNRKIREDLALVRDMRLRYGEVLYGEILAEVNGTPPSKSQAVEQSGSRERPRLGLREEGQVGDIRTGVSY